MGRHAIPQRDTNAAALRITIGWDPPLRTFFANVIDTAKDEADDDSATLLLVGCQYDEIQTVQELQERIAAYADIPTELVPILEQEQAEALAQPRTPGQDQIEVFLKGLFPNRV